MKATWHEFLHETRVNRSIRKYSEDQLRDDHGRWTAGGAETVSPAKQDASRKHRYRDDAENLKALTSVYGDKLHIHDDPVYNPSPVETRAAETMGATQEEMARGFYSDRAADQSDKIAALAGLPKDLHQAVAAHGVEIHIGSQDVTNYNGYGQLADAQPLGYTEGSSFHNVSGVYTRTGVEQPGTLKDSSTDLGGQLVIGYVKGQHSGGELALHEFGHAVDDTFGIVRSGSFGPAYQEWYNNWPAHEGINYYRQDGTDPTGRGAQEMFAQAFSDYHFKGSEIAKINWGQSAVDMVEKASFKMPGRMVFY